MAWNEKRYELEWELGQIKWDILESDSERTREMCVELE